MMLHGLLAVLGRRPVALAVCALGRSLDFATTWVGLEHGRAAELKRGAAQIIQLLGPHAGLIACEALITTPVIFLGCKLTQMIATRPLPAGVRRLHWLPAENSLLYFVGLVSVITAVHNLPYLF